MAHHRLLRQKYQVRNFYSSPSKGNKVIIAHNYIGETSLVIPSRNDDTMIQITFLPQQTLKKWNW